MPIEYRVPIEVRPPVRIATVYCVGFTVALPFPGEGGVNTITYHYKAMDEYGVVIPEAAQDFSELVSPAGGGAGLAAARVAIMARAYAVAPYPEGTVR